MTVAPRERQGWRWTAYRIVTGPRLAEIRMVVIGVQIPIAIAITALAQSVRYLVFISLITWFESAFTDWVGALKFVNEE